jgi:hypothetical protein
MKGEKAYFEKDKLGFMFRTILNLITIEFAA